MKTWALVTVLMVGAAGLALCGAGVTLLVSNRPAPAPAATPVAAVAPSWYLMMPPVWGDSCYTGEPYAKWELMDSYATSAECHKEADANGNLAFDQPFLNRYSANLKKRGYPATPRALGIRLSNAMCFASNDPHLAASQPTAQPTEAPATDPGYKSL